MHSWGSDFKYFADVENAAYEIGKFCKQWGKIQVRQTKEKFGTARIYCSFGCKNLHSFFYPGYVWMGYPRWLYKLLEKLFPNLRIHYRIMGFPLFVWTYPVLIPWQKFIYRLAYKRALKKYPHIRHEILAVADYWELVDNLYTHNEIWELKKEESEKAEKYQNLYYRALERYKKLAKSYRQLKK